MTPTDMFYPTKVVGKYVMLKIKDNTIRFFHDDQLITTYQTPEGKYRLIGENRFYDSLKRDQDQLKRKYGRNKGAATLRD